MVLSIQFGFSVRKDSSLKFWGDFLVVPLTALTAVFFTRNCVINQVGVGSHSRLAELDQVLVRGPRMEAADVQVRFAQLFPSPTTAIATAVGVGTRGCHLVGGGHIGLL